MMPARSMSPQRTYSEMTKGVFFGDTVTSLQVVEGVEVVEVIEGTSCLSSITSTTSTPSTTFVQYSGTRNGANAYVISASYARCRSISPTVRIPTAPCAC